ncbi:MAG: hypothetical protein OXF24_04410, partial [Hyphomicrobiales bacterium]|nr:hypothetical protein [Hyphomicrobiales bacterium]
SVEPDVQKDAPANHWKCRGALWVGLQTDAMGPYIRRELNLFCDQSEKLQDFGGILGIFMWFW